MVEKGVMHRASAGPSAVQSGAVQVSTAVGEKAAEPVAAYVAEPKRIWYISPMLLSARFTFALKVFGLSFKTGSEGTKSARVSMLRFSPCCPWRSSIWIG